MRIPPPLRALAPFLPLALAACAHAPAARSPARDAAPPARVLVTGSRIPQPVDPRTGLPATISPVRIVTRAELIATGRADDLAAALGTLEPALGR